MGLNADAQMRVAEDFEDHDCVRAAWHPDAGLLNVLFTGRDVDEEVFETADEIGYKPANIHPEWLYDSREYLCIQFVDPDIREVNR